jgi:hypothetical protein
MFTFFKFQVFSLGGTISTAFFKHHASGTRWRCYETKHDVSLAPSDDRPCQVCYVENEQQVDELRRQVDDTLSQPEAGPSEVKVGATGKLDLHAELTRDLAENLH